MKVAITSILIVLQLSAAVAGPLQNNPALNPREDYSLLINQAPTTTKSFSRIVASKPPVTSVPSSASIAEPSSSLRLPVGTRTTSASSSSVVSTTTSTSVQETRRVKETRSFRRPPEDTPVPSQGTPVPSAPASSAPISSVPVSSGASSAPGSSVPASSGSSTFTSSRRFVRPTQPQPPSSSDQNPSPPATVTATVTVTASAQPPPPPTPTTSAVSTTSVIPTTPATPTTSRPASRPPSGTQPPSSANNNNTALAIALNKNFAALTASSPCDAKNLSQLHACIDGDFHTCGGDGKYAKVVDCVAPLACFALPLETSTGASVACIAPADAALRMGFNSEGELQGALGKRSISNQT
ncbi:hypothetical protein HOY80DRAFT_996787 [Tuber brumale]|nr:hypothetical protein HOY80DRAFT_996787 [Tuber brumale]